MLDWSNLNYFLALARSGSLSAASKALGTDHSTVARRIEALERELNLRLVDRRARSYSLTSAGQQIRDRALRVETAIADIERFAQGATHLPYGTVRVSGPPAFLTHFIAPRLLKLQHQHPGLQIELIGGAREVSLKRNEAELALRMSRPEESDLVARKLTEMAYGLYGSRDYLNGRLPKDWDFLGQDEGRDHLPQQKWLRSIAAGRGFALRANDMTALIGAARAGLGLAVLPHSLARRDTALREVPTPNPAPSRDLWLVYHRDLGKVPAIRAVIGYLTEVISSNRKAFGGR